MVQIDGIVIGAGQAGLATSWHLRRLGLEHLVLERAAYVGDAWVSQRWNSFHAVTPNWMMNLPGAPYAGGHPEGFMSRAAIAALLQCYVERFELPVRYRSTVRSLHATRDGLRLSTESGEFLARNVVVATGAFARPFVPGAAARLQPPVIQLHSSQYRKPSALPAGAVLVVGASQSGVQIADELHRAGRRVFLSVGRASRVPRRYRGRDIMQWASLLGLPERTAESLAAGPSMPNPQITGAQGGRSLDLHEFARDGISLAGRLVAFDGARVRFAADLRRSLEGIDASFRSTIEGIDAQIERWGWNVPKEVIPVLRHGYDAPPILDLYLHEAGVTSVIWATGFRSDYSFVRVPAFDTDGRLRHSRGITEVAGLYFMGLHLQHKAKSSLMFGVDEDAQHIAEHIAARRSLHR